MDNLSHMTDDELVDLYISGRNDAFDEILLRHKDRLYNYISIHLNQQKELADDVFQETFVKVIVTLKEGRYEKSNRFYAWVTRIAHNIIMDQFRHDSQFNIVTCEGEERNLLDDAGIVESYHEAKIINEQTLIDVKRLVNNLPATQREVVIMRFFQNMSFKEIADSTGVSINTSLGRMRYALINMRKMANEHGISLEIL